MWRKSSLAIVLLCVSSFAAQAQTWVSLSPLPAARAQAAVVADADGLIHVLGGDSGVASTATHAVYDPASDNWSSAADVPVAMYGGHAVLGPDGNLYLFGFSPESGLVHIYDPAGDSWSTSASLGHAIGWQSAGAFGPDGMLYIFGGEENPTETVRYDPGADSWTSRASLPEERLYHGALLAEDGRIHIFGGMDTGDTVYDSTRIYDPAADSWSDGPDMPAAVVSFAYGSYGGRFYVAGGSTDYFNDYPPYFDSVYVFDGNQWVTFPSSLPTARREAGGTVSRGAFYVIGGSDGSSLATNEALVGLPASIPPDVPAASPLGLLLTAAGLALLGLWFTRS